MSNLYSKLAQARIDFQDLNIKKNGANEYAKFKYFELKDIVPPKNVIFNKLGLLDVFVFGREEATLTIINCEVPEERLVFSFDTNVESIEAKMGTDKQSQGMQPVQRLGSVSTYLERYLLSKALGISENDNIDALKPISEEEQNAIKQESVAIRNAKKELNDFLLAVCQDEKDIAISKKNIAKEYGLTANSTSVDYQNALNKLKQEAELSVDLDNLS